MGHILQDGEKVHYRSCFSKIQQVLTGPFFNFFSMFQPVEEVEEVEEVAWEKKERGGVGASIHLWDCLMCFSLVNN